MGRDIEVEGKGKGKRRRKRILESIRHFPRALACLRVGEKGATGCVRQFDPKGFLSVARGGGQRVCVSSGRI